MVTVKKYLDKVAKGFVENFPWLCCLVWYLKLEEVVSDKRLTLISQIIVYQVKGLKDAQLKKPATKANSSLLKQACSKFCDF